MQRRSIKCLYLAVFTLGAFAGCGAESNTDPSNPSCSDVCAPQSNNWNGPVLLWFGPAGEEPICPSDAPNVEYEGHANLVASNECTACTCGPSEGTCSPTTEVMFYMAEMACMRNDPAYSFNPPLNWDGSCYADGVVAANTFNMISMNPHYLTNDHCTALSSSSQLNDPAISWETSARACSAKPNPECDGLACIHQDRESETFSTCVYGDGDRLCPVEYPFPHVFYAGFDDQRACTSCECDAPVGSNCVGGVSFYGDTECKDLKDLLPQDAFGHGGKCVTAPEINPTPFWYSIGSIAVNKLDYWPGTCAASGGKLVGQAKRTEPTTFCCRDFKK